MMIRHMKMDANSWRLRSTGKNGQKRNVYCPLDDMVVGGTKTEGISDHL